MQKENYYVVGVMSGTSLDGIDFAHIHFRLMGNKWSFNILECETIPYSSEWVQRLKSAIDFSTSQLDELNHEYTALLAKHISYFIAKHKIKSLDAVCSHGHTILHQPHNGLTLQIGNHPEIAKLCGQTIVCDFRVQDVQLGGQGAPLVPIGDRILFPEFDYCLNLGGFSNISFEDGTERVAFDISPVNTVLNYYSNQLGLDYDDKGAIARTGRIVEDLFAELNALDFYKKTYPKSLGVEYVKQTILPLIERYDISIENKMRTFTEHVALQTSLALPKKKGKLLLSGGGAYNQFMIERMKYYLPEIEVVIPETKILEYKEALIFALLGVLKLRNEINVLGSVTGAKKDHSAGNIFYK